MQNEKTVIIDDYDAYADVCNQDPSAQAYGERHVQITASFDNDGQERCLWLTDEEARKMAAALLRASAKATDFGASRLFLTLPSAAEGLAHAKTILECVPHQPDRLVAFSALQVGLNSVVAEVFGTKGGK